LDELMARWDTTLVAEARADIIESRREDLETTGDALRAALGSLIQERDQLSKENARLAIRVIEREHEVMDEAVQAVNWHKKADAAEAHCRLLEQERDEARRRVEHYRDHDYQLYDKMIHDLTGEHAAKPVLPWETSVPDNVAAHKEGK